MASLNAVLIPFITGCLGMASGIFFVLYCLEGPIYSPVFRKDGYDVDSDAQVRRVLRTLQQFLTFSLPIVMVTLIFSAAIGSGFRIFLYGFAPLPILVSVCIGFAIVYSALFVPSAIKIFKTTSPEASSNEVQMALAPIVRLHRNVGIIIATTLVFQLLSIAFG